MDSPQPQLPGSAGKGKTSVSPRILQEEILRPFVVGAAKVSTFTSFIFIFIIVSEFKNIEQSMVLIIPIRVLIFFIFFFIRFFPILCHHILTYTMLPILQGLLRAITLGTRRFSSSVTQDMLCVLNIWFKYGHFPDVAAAIESGLSNVHLDNWLGVLPQLIARIHHTGILLINFIVCYVHCIILVNDKDF